MCADFLQSALDIQKAINIIIIYCFYIAHFITAVMSMRLAKKIEYMYKLFHIISMYAKDLQYYQKNKLKFARLT